MTCQPWSRMWSEEAGVEHCIHSQAIYLGKITIILCIADFHRIIDAYTIKTYGNAFVRILCSGSGRSSFCHQMNAAVM